MKNILHVLATPRTFKAGETVVYIDTTFNKGYIVGSLEAYDMSLYPLLFRSQDDRRSVSFTFTGRYDKDDSLRSLLTIKEAKECGLDVIIPIPDKALVWCWDNNVSHTRHARFYDKRNGCTFNWAGSRDGAKLDNYVQITEEEIKASPMLQNLLAKVDSLEA